MSRSAFYLIGLAGAIAISGACTAANPNVFTSSSTGGGGEGGAGGRAGSTGTGPTGTGGEPILIGSSSGNGSSSGTVCNNPPDVDGDGDGYTGAQGDCNDCDPNVNPGAIDVPTPMMDADGGVPTPVDEDCNGVVDDSPQPCDTNLALTSPDPYDGARAIELCKIVTNPTSNEWGVLSAMYVRADGTPYQTPGPQVGLQDGFGPNVNNQAGNRILVMSSGHARVIGQQDECGYNSCSSNFGGTPPPGFPQDVPGCSGSTAINDDIGLDVTLRAPTNATGFKFNFDFYSFEYPEWVCTSFNDQFIALVNPPPMGSINGNISFDSMNNPVSVNIAFFTVCAGCQLGTNDLVGTGFDVWNDAGATSWLQSQAPIQGGSVFTIRFAIWDTGDSAFDSTVLIDNFQWIANGGTVVVSTDPVPTPK